MIMDRGGYLLTIYNAYNAENSVSARFAYLIQPNGTLQPKVASESTLCADLALSCLALFLGLVPFAPAKMFPPFDGPAQGILFDVCHGWHFEPNGSQPQTSGRSRRIRRSVDNWSMLEKALQIMSVDH
jgi:hypothetical protein